VSPPPDDASAFRSAVFSIDPSTQLFHVDGMVLGRDLTGTSFALEDLDLQGLRAVLGAIDGRRSVAEVAALLARECDADDVMSLIAQLEGTVLRRRAMRSTSSPSESALTAAVCIVGTGPIAREISGELVERGFSKISTLDCGRLSSCETDDFRRGLDALAVHAHAHEAGPPAGSAGSRSWTVADLTASFAGYALVICALEGVRGQAFLDVNAACLSAGVPAIFVAVEGSRSIVGPTVIPFRSPCFACSRLSTTLRPHYDGAGPRLLPFISFGAHDDSPRWLLHRTACEVADEVASVLCGAPYPARISAIWFQERTGATGSLKVDGVTSCPACHAYHRAARGDASTPTPPSRLVRVEDEVRDSENGVRSTSADDALRNAARTLERVGVDVELLPLGGSAPESFVAIACPYYSTRHSARFSLDLPIVWRRFIEPSLGKGVTESQAKCSAMFEWLERNLSDWHGDRPLVRAKYADVADRAINLPFVASGLLPNLTPVGQRVYTEAEEIDWVWAHCLRSDRPILLPAVCAFLSSTLFRGKDLALPNSGSSGLSAGCTVADAVLQGLLEIVERDASATAMRNGLSLPVIDEASICDPAARDLLRRTRAAGYDAIVLDMTGDIGIPAIEVYLVREGEYTHYYGLGLGAHLDPEIALRRSLTEAAQSLFYDVTQNAFDPLQSLGSRFDFFPYRQQSLVPRGDKRQMSDLPRLCDANTPTWKQVDRVVSKIAEAIPEGDICMVDLTPSVASGVHIVRTFASGTLYETRLVHFHIPERCRVVPLAEMFLGRYEG
jgi:thiazole/oxazole-forming peptide maturase SagD family component